MITRRGFFKALAGAAVVAFVPATVAAKPIALAPDAASLGWIDMANAIAFNIVGDILPEHQGYYRARALEAAHRYVSRRTS